MFAYKNFFVQIEMRFDKIRVLIYYVNLCTQEISEGAVALAEAVFLNLQKVVISPDPIRALEAGVVLACRAGHLIAEAEGRDDLAVPPVSVSTFQSLLTKLLLQPKR